MYLAELEPGSMQKSPFFPSFPLFFLPLPLSHLSPLPSSLCLAFIPLSPLLSFICDENSDLTIRTGLNSTGLISQHIALRPVSGAGGGHAEDLSCQAAAQGPLPSTLMTAPWHLRFPDGKTEAPKRSTDLPEIVQPVIQQVGKAWI